MQTLAAAMLADAVADGAEIEITTVTIRAKRLPALPPPPEPIDTTGVPTSDWAPVISLDAWRQSKAVA